jgi:hypothetical protein
VYFVGILSIQPKIFRWNEHFSAKFHRFKFVKSNVYVWMTFSPKIFRSKIEYFHFYPMNSGAARPPFFGHFKNVHFGLYMPEFWKTKCKTLKNGLVTNMLSKSDFLRKSSLLIIFGEEESSILEIFLCSLYVWNGYRKKTPKISKICMQKMWFYIVKAKWIWTTYWDEQA